MRSATFTQYKDWSPSAVDANGLLGDRLGVSDWYVVPVTKTRDSGVLEVSNFECFRRLCRYSGAQVHRFGHWAVGWIEVILVSPKSQAMEEAQELYESLSRYAVLDEEDYDRRCEEARQEVWGGFGLADRIHACRKCGVSIFASRRDDYPPTDNGSMEWYLIDP